MTDPAFIPASDKKRAKLRLPLALVIMDGFGLGSAGPGNAITLAKTPNLDALRAEFPETTLACSGLAVGLPAGQMAFSGVGVCPVPMAQMGS